MSILFSFGSVSICGLLLLLASLGSDSSYVSAQQFLLKRSNEFSLWKSSKREACFASLCFVKFAEMREFSVAGTKTIGLVSKVAAAAALNLYLLHTPIRVQRIRCCCAFCIFGDFFCKLSPHSNLLPHAVTGAAAVTQRTCKSSGQFRRATMQGAPCPQTLVVLMQLVIMFFLAIHSSIRTSTFSSTQPALWHCGLPLQPLEV